MTKKETPPPQESPEKVKPILEPGCTPEKIKSESRKLNQRVRKFEKEWYG